MCFLSLHVNTLLLQLMSYANQYTTNNVDLTFSYTRRSIVTALAPALARSLQLKIHGLKELYSPGYRH